MDQTPAATAGGTREQLLAEALEGLDAMVCRHWRQGAAAHLERRDLSSAQLHLLMVLQELGPQTVGQLAERLRVSLPSASLMVDRLEDHGLAARDRDAHDRRLVHVRLSEKGVAAARDAAGFRREVAGRVLSHFRREELVALLAVLDATERALAALAAEKEAG